MNSCAVIIVNYNTGKLLSRVIECVIKAKEVDEIIVVDNNSTDNSMELLSNSSKVIKHFRKTNAGFGSSCNYGAKYAQSKYLLFLNPDCLIQEESIVMALRTFKNNSNVAMVGALVRNPDGTEQKATRRRLPTLWRAIRTYSKLEKLAKYCACFAGVNLNHKPLNDELQRVEATSGAFIFIKASVFNEIGQFDEAFFMHFEDLDLCKRVCDAGYNILLNPGIEVVHYQGTSSQSNSSVSEYKKQSLQRYFRKHCSLFSYYVIKNISRFLR
jgi:GT2 family glycosyltransferase